MLFRNGERRKVGEEAEGKMHGQLLVRKKASQTQMLPSEIINPYITLLYLWGFTAYNSPAHFTAKTLGLLQPHFVVVSVASM